MSAVLNKTRKLAEGYIRSHQCRNACFWADKARILSNNDPNDTLLFSQALYLDQQYRRAVHMLTKEKKASKHTAFRYMIALCQAGSQQWLDVLETLGDPVPDSLTAGMQTFGDTNQDEEMMEITQDICFLSTDNLLSAIMVLKGKASEALGNVEDAIEFFKVALTLDVFCSEALERITHNQYLTCQEEVDLLQSLPFEEQCSKEEGDLLKYTYSMMLNDNKRGSVPPLPESCVLIEKSPDLVCMKAKKLLLSIDVGPCMDITTALLEENPYNLNACELVVQACVLEKNSGLLYGTAQRLVQTFPNLALSWFAVACYYLLQNSHNQVRKYLEKSLALDKLYILSWIAYGVSFSENGEYDQAITAFSTAAHIMKGSHFPVLYLAKEYYHTGAGAVATQFLKQAVLSHPTSPAVLQEVGVMFYDAGRYDLALKYMKQAKSNLKAIDSESAASAWEPVYNNLGHIHRKLGQLDLALDAHFTALQLKQKEPSSHTAIALLYLLKKEHEKATEYCFYALSLNRREAMALKILHLSTAQLAVTPSLSSMVNVALFPHESIDDDRVDDVGEPLVESTPTVSSAFSLQHGMIVITPTNTEHQ